MSSDIRILLVDDEPACRDTLRSFVRSGCPEAQIVGEAASVAEAAQRMEATSPNLLLLDVHLSDGTGFDLLDRFAKPDFRVIFTTAYDDFAVRAFRYSAVDYLLKPIDPDLLTEAVHKAGVYIPSDDRQQQLAQLRHNAATRTFDRITLHTGDGLLFVHTADIMHLEANGNCTFVHLADGERHLVNRTLKEFEEILPEPAFFRIHQSYLVKIDGVKKYLKDDGGYVVMRDGAKLPIARRRKDAFLRELGG